MVIKMIHFAGLCHFFASMQPHSYFHLVSLYKSKIPLPNTTSFLLQLIKVLSCNQWDYFLMFVVFLLRSIIPSLPTFGSTLASSRVLAVVAQPSLLCLTSGSTLLNALPCFSPSSLRSAGCICSTLGCLPFRSL